MIYFDYTSTTKPNPELLKLHQKISLEYWYNTESLYNEGVKGKMLLERACLEVNNCLKTSKGVLFTSGATESNNLAIFGVCNKYLKEPKHLITTTLEHASVLKCFKELENRGFEVTYLKPNKDGIISVKELEKAIKPTTILVSIMWVNNIIGSIQPLAEVIKICKQHPRLRLHSDMVQGIGKLKPDFNLDDLDYITISGHKLHGLKGTGILLYNKKYQISFLQGGHQQNQLRPGTVDLASCVVMAKTLKLAIANQANEFNKTTILFKYLINNLDDNKYIYHVSKYSSPYILSLTFPTLKGETALHALEQKGICVGTGSACNSSSNEQELTLVDTLEDPSKAINTIRISLCSELSFEDIDRLIKSLKEIGK